MKSLNANGKTEFSTPHGWFTKEQISKALPYWGCRWTGSEYLPRPEKREVARLKEDKHEGTRFINVTEDFFKFQIALKRAEMAKVKNPYKSNLNDYLDEAIRLAKIYAVGDLAASELKKSYNELMQEVEEKYKVWWNNNYSQK